MHVISSSVGLVLHIKSSHFFICIRGEGHLVGSILQVYFGVQDKGFSLVHPPTLILAPFISSYESKVNLNVLKTGSINSPPIKMASRSESGALTLIVILFAAVRPPSILVYVPSITLSVRPVSTSSSFPSLILSVAIIKVVEKARLDPSAFMTVTIKSSIFFEEPSFISLEISLPALFVNLIVEDESVAEISSRVYLFPAIVIDSSGFLFDRTTFTAFLNNIKDSKLEVPVSGDIIKLSPNKVISSPIKSLSVKSTVLLNVIVALYK